MYTELWIEAQQQQQPTRGKREKRRIKKKANKPKGRTMPPIAINRKPLMREREKR